MQLLTKQIHIHARHALVGFSSPAQPSPDQTNIINCLFYLIRKQNHFQVSDACLPACLPHSTPPSLPHITVFVFSPPFIYMSHKMFFSNCNLNIFASCSNFKNSQKDVKKSFNVSSSAAMFT